MAAGPQAPAAHRGACTAPTTSRGRVGLPLFAARARRHRRAWVVGVPHAQAGRAGWAGPTE
eukprot:5161702-Pyramimonas_sp.AAC.1